MLADSLDENVIRFTWFVFKVKNSQCMFIKIWILFNCSAAIQDPSHDEMNSSGRDYRPLSFGDFILCTIII